MHADRKDPMPEDLQAVVEAWRGLPEAIKKGILAMVRTQTEGRQV